MAYENRSLVNCCASIVTFVTKQILTRKQMEKRHFVMPTLSTLTMLLLLLSLFSVHMFHLVSMQAIDVNIDFLKSNCDLCESNDTLEAWNSNKCRDFYLKSDVRFSKFRPHPLLSIEDLHVGGRLHATMQRLFFLKVHFVIKWFVFIVGINLHVISW